MQFVGRQGGGPCHPRLACCSVALELGCHDCRIPQVKGHPHMLQHMKMSQMMQGLRRPGMPKTFQMSQSFAIHEVGKALVATVMRQDRERQGLKPRLERVERVSMVPRGRCSPSH